MTLTQQNYHSVEANLEYMSVSQFKSAFIDLPNTPACEARALAEIRGEYVRDSTTALLVGSYIDAYFSGSLDTFKTEHPEIFTQKGELRADYKQAEVTIARIQQDETMMRYLSGEMQSIHTGNIAGIPFKVKIDSYHVGKCIVDLKCMRDFDSVWNNGTMMHWIEAWAYPLQAAVYQAVEGHDLPFIIAAATKQAHPDIGLYSVPQGRISAFMNKVVELAPRLAAIKKGSIAPERCEICDYCRDTKKLKGVVSYE